MFKAKTSFYLGKNNGYFSDIFFEENLFFCFEAKTGFNNNEKKISLLIKEKLQKQKIFDLASFDEFIVSLIKEINPPSNFSIVAGFLKDDIFYLKTIGEGMIFIKRKNNFGLLLDGDNTASGKIEENDFFIFTSKTLINFFGSTFEFEKIFKEKNYHEAVNFFSSSLNSEKDQGLALLINFQKDFLENYHQEDQKIKEKNLLFDRFKKTYLLMKESKKTLTFLVVIFLTVIFFWSVVLGYQRRQNKIISEKIKKTKEIIQEKLQMAEEVAFLNLDRALILINESEEEIEKLEKQVKGKNKDFEDLRFLVKEAKNKLLKKEEKKFTEFFDLTVDNKEAKGERLYFDGDWLFILDKNQGFLYKFSLEKKTLEKYQAKELKETSVIGGFDGKGFFYLKGKGIYRFDNDTLKKVVDNDKEWGEIIGMSFYNGNLYLLDKGKDEVWKYLPSEDGYGNKISYFQQGEAIDLERINSLAIDGSVYLAGDNLVFKYTSGAKDDFQINLPEKENHFEKIFTNKDLNKIYLWDKKKGVLYVLEKTGEYLEQINSPILSKGNDLVVYKDKIYVLLEAKIYRID